MSHTDAWYRFEDISPTASTANVTKNTVKFLVFEFCQNWIF